MRAAAPAAAATVTGAGNGRRRVGTD